MIKVLVADPISQLGIDVLQKDPALQVDVKLKQTEDQLVAIIGEYDALVVRSETKVTKRVIDAAQRLKVIGRAGVGVDNIDLNAAKAKGILVVNTPGGNTIAAAEHTFGMLLALARHVPQAHNDLKEGNWNRTKYTGTELRKKTLGILGLGRIGREVANFARAFGMNIVAFDPYAVKEQAANIGVKLVDFESVLQEADFLTVHMPLTSESRKLIAQEQFSLMKDGACLINCARGGIICEEALYQAIVAGKIKGAALDVFEKEPMVCNPLFELDQVIVTPHLGASTKEAQVNVAIEVCEDVLGILKGNTPINPVFTLKNAKSA
ncbi:MAG TPA: hydroxyacid dehydrogenase [Verrucomicrobiae bacterium]|nr:hydroxyacid dehydrogenase [Verrucomicrobiae bacterium]